MESSGLLNVITSLFSTDFFATEKRQKEKNGPVPRRVLSRSPEIELHHLLVGYQSIRSLQPDPLSSPAQPDVERKSEEEESAEKGEDDD